MQRWSGTRILGDPKIAEEVKRFFAGHGVKTVVVGNAIMGCPHEEGEDYPNGVDCPFCPFWAGKQGSTRRDSVDEEQEEVAEDDEADAPDEEERDWDAASARAAAILGDTDVDFDKQMDVMLAHLQATLQLPCEVTGIEDFQWEEKYVIGGWDPREYKRLKKTRPSYTDRFQLLAISRDGFDEWMMFSEDIVAHVRRISDGRQFDLGLSELEATDRKSASFQLLDDYSVWFFNNR